MSQDTTKTATESQPEMRLARTFPISQRQLKSMERNQQGLDEYASRPTASPMSYEERVENHRKHCAQFPAGHWVHLVPIQ
jgi:hypothetical protein